MVILRDFPYISAWFGLVIEWSLYPLTNSSNLIFWFGIIIFSGMHLQPQGTSPSREGCEKVLSLFLPACFWCREVGNSQQEAKGSSKGGSKGGAFGIPWQEVGKTAAILRFFFWIGSEIQTVSEATRLSMLGVIGLVSQRMLIICNFTHGIVHWEKEQQQMEYWGKSEEMKICENHWAKWQIHSGWKGPLPSCK